MSYIKVLQEKKKEKMLENIRDKLKKEIEDLENAWRKNNMLQKWIEEEDAKEAQTMKDHIDAMKVLKLDNESKIRQVVEILTHVRDDNTLLN